MGFDIVIDSKKTLKGFVKNKLSAVLPKTVYFSQAENWEIAIMSLWYNNVPVTTFPLYINCSMIETQMVGPQYEKTLFILLPKQSASNGNIHAIRTIPQYKKIFSSHVSKINFSFYLSDGTEFNFEQSAHMIINLNIRKVHS